MELVPGSRNWRGAAGLFPRPYCWLVRSSFRTMSVSVALLFSPFSRSSLVGYGSIGYYLGAAGSSSVVRSGSISLLEASWPCRSRYGEKVSLNFASVESISTYLPEVPLFLFTRKM